MGWRGGIDLRNKRDDADEFAQLQRQIESRSAGQAEETDSSPSGSENTVSPQQADVEKGDIQQSAASGHVSEQDIENIDKHEPNAKEDT